MKGSIRKRGSAWEYTFDLGKIDDNKRKRFIKGGFKTKKLAEVALREKISEFENGVVIKETKFTVSEYMNYWLENYASINLKYRTQERYKTEIRNYITPEIGYYKVNNISPIVLQNLLTKMAQSGYARNTIKGVFGVLSISFKWAVKWNFIKYNPMANVSIPKIEKEPDIVVFNNEELTKILERFKDTQYWIPLMIGLNTGMRVGEVCGLEWKNVNFENRIIRVVSNLQKQNGEWKLTSPKTAAGIRSIPINNLLYDKLVKAKEFQNFNKEKYGEFYTESNFVCTKENGESVTTNTIKYLSQVINKNLGIYFKFHFLRHTFASKLLEAGEHPKVVQEILGHKKISTTLDTYSHVTSNLKSTAVESIETFISKSLTTK